MKLNGSILIIGVVINFVTLIDTFLQKFNYEEIRNDIIEAENFMSIGGETVLNDKEKKVDEILRNLKTDELVMGYNDESKLWASQHFFKVKSGIEASKVFKFLKMMPKGALLHGHSKALVSSEWVIKNLTYYTGVMKCTRQNGVVILTFRNSSKHQCESDYVDLNAERKKFGNNEIYDKNLEKLINLYTPTPEIEYTFLTNVWKKFQNMFTTIDDLITYMPAYRAYNWRLLEEMYEDGIFYIELRNSFFLGYDGLGKEYSFEMVAEELLNVVYEFKIQHPGFLGVKIIYTTNRKIDKAVLKEVVETFRQLFYKFPNFIIGFDLVGQEDLGNNLYDFYKTLQTLPREVKYFFHSGETKWYGSVFDYNLLDAILLNTTRIGHGYSLTNHPILLKKIKENDIAIEVNLLSNQILNLVKDLRNHPATLYFSKNIPIVISNDDPGFWAAKGLSYDYYYALMSIASNNAGLKFLKTLVWNSIKYSVLLEHERSMALELMDKNWNKFLDKILSNSM